MIGTVFQSEDVPTADRFDYWRELISRTRSTDFISPYSAQFWGSYSCWSWGRRR